MQASSGSNWGGGYATAMWDRQAAKQTIIAGAAVKESPHGTPAMWGKQSSHAGQ